MKRYIMAAIAYIITGIGVYHTFFGGANIYGLLILIIGLIGILSDIFNEKLKTE